MDNLLLQYLKATDESERQQLLDELLIVYAAPVVRQTLRQKLGFHVNQFSVNPYNPDAEDLYHEIITKIIEVLTILPETPRTQIEKFEPYVAVIATNACLDYIRAKSPARTRLKYSIREVLNRRSESFCGNPTIGFFAVLRPGRNSASRFHPNGSLKSRLGCRSFAQLDLAATILDMYGSRES